MPMNKTGSVGNRDAGGIVSSFLGTAIRTVPDDIRHAAARILLNYLRAIIPAVREPLPIALRAAESARLPDGDIGASVLFTGTRLPTDEAALCNQQMSTLLLLDDIEMISGTHPGGPAVSAALAIAEKLERAGETVSGKTLLSAIAAGVELQISVAIASAPEMLHGRGFAPLSVLAPLGAAATGSILENLSIDETRHALGMAAMSGIGMWEMGGTSSAGFLTACAMRSGLASLRAAQTGFQAPQRAIDGEFGSFRAFTGKPPEMLTEELTKLGRIWRTSDVFFQPFSGDTYVQAPLCAVRDLMDRLVDPVKLPAVNTIVVKVNQRVAEGVAQKYMRHQTIEDALVLNSDPQSRVAAAWLQKAFSFDRNFPTLLEDQEVATLRDRVKFISEPSISDMTSAIVEVHFVDGTIERAETSAFPGSIANPLSDDQLSHVFREAAYNCLSEARIERILAAVWSLDESSSIGGLVDEIADPFDD